VLDLRPVARLRQHQRRSSATVWTCDLSSTTTCCAINADYRSFGGQVSSGAEVAGPGLAGVLIKTLGAPVALLVDALLLALSAAILRGVRVVEPPPRSARAATSAKSCWWACASCAASACW
jgi:hypothetical protein